MEALAPTQQRKHLLVSTNPDGTLASTWRTLCALTYLTVVVNL